MTAPAEARRTADALRAAAGDALARTDSRRADFALGEDALAADGEVDRSWKPLGEVAAYLATWLPAWIDDWLDLRRWDLLGELLVVDACLPCPTLDETAWRAFAAAQQPDGAMPAVRDMPEGVEEAVFDGVYHSTLVAAFASVLATSRALTELTGATS